MKQKNLKKFWKRGTGILLSAAMLLTAVPAGATEFEAVPQEGEFLAEETAPEFSAETEDAASLLEDGTILKINATAETDATNNTYKTIKEALEATSTTTDPVTIQLETDIQECVTIPENRNIILDLDRSHLFNFWESDKSQEPTMTVSQGASLTIQGKVDEEDGQGQLFSQNKNSPALSNKEGGTVIIESGFLWSSNSPATIINQGTMTLGGATAPDWIYPSISPGDEFIGIWNKASETTTPKLIIKNANINADQIAIKNDPGATLEINGGGTHRNEHSYDGHRADILNCGTAVITSGNIDQISTCAEIKDGAVSYAGETTIVGDSNDPDLLPNIQHARTLLIGTEDQLNNYPTNEKKATLKISGGLIGNVLKETTDTILEADDSRSEISITGGTYLKDSNLLTYCPASYTLLTKEDFGDLRFIPTAEAKNTHKIQIFFTHKLDQLPGNVKSRNPDGIYQMASGDVLDLNILTRQAYAGQTDGNLSEKQSYYIAGWYKDTDLKEPWKSWDIEITEDISLYPRWADTHTVTFDSQGGSAVPEQKIKQTYIEDHIDNNKYQGWVRVAEPETPTKDGYIFDGWYTDLDDEYSLWDFDGNTLIDETLTLYAKWTKETQKPTVTPDPTPVDPTPTPSTPVNPPTTPVPTATPTPEPTGTPTPTPTETPEPTPTPTPGQPSTDTPAPVKPTVTSKTTDKVTISWKLSPDADGYTIWVKMEGEKNYTRKQITSEEAKSFTLKNCKPGKKYYFVVKPWKKAADGSYIFSEESTTLRATTKPRPAVIKNVTVSPSGDLKVSVSGAAGADHYAMCYSKTSDFGKYQIGIRTSYATRTMAKGLSNGTYYVKVRSYRQLDKSTRVYGDWSKAVKVTVK